VSGLCKHCMDIVLWRKQYRKYKPLTNPKKCVACGQKAVREAYHVLCGPCAQAKHVCAKCQAATEIQPPTCKTGDEIRREQQMMEKHLASLSLRHRRTWMRKLEQCDDEASRAALMEDILALEEAAESPDDASSQSSVE